ncbi:MAG: Hpt domain-containing protein [Planctomycetota bacterium]
MEPAEPRTGALIDWPTLLEDMGGDEEILLEIVELFLEYVDDQVEDLGEALDAGDPARLDRAAHKLKGSVAQFGYEPARVLAYELEEAGKAGRATGLGDVQARLLGELDRLRGELRRFADGEA